MENKNIELIKQFKKEYDRFPYIDEEYKGVNLGNYCLQLLHSNIDDNVKKELFSIGFPSDEEYYIWNVKFSLVKEFIEKYNKIPGFNDSYKGFDMRRWIDDQLSTCENDYRIEALQSLLDNRYKSFKELINKFVDYNYNYSNHEANKDVLIFIGNILYHDGVDNTDTIIKLFSCGYCYYFAKMLQDAFPGGKICQPAPYSHIVYVLDNIPYDIQGLCDLDYDELIPIEKLDDLESYKHRNGEIL